MIDSGNTVLILRKWLDEGTLLLWQGNFRDTSFALTGIVSSLADEECVVTSRKGEAKLAFRFGDPECRFEYRERRSFTGSDSPEEFSEKAHLLIFFPPRFSLAEISSETTEGRDKLTVSELHPSEVKNLD
jgi:hypothetical protein